MGKKVIIKDGNFKFDGKKDRKWTCSFNVDANGVISGKNNVSFRNVGDFEKTYSGTLNDDSLLLKASFSGGLVDGQIVSYEGNIVNGKFKGKMNIIKPGMKGVTGSGVCEGFLEIIFFQDDDDDDEVIEEEEVFPPLPPQLPPQEPSFNFDEIIDDNFTFPEPSKMEEEEQQQELEAIESFEWSDFIIEPPEEVDVFPGNEILAFQTIEFEFVLGLTSERKKMSIPLNRLCPYCTKLCSFGDKCKHTFCDHCNRWFCHVCLSVPKEICTNPNDCYVDVDWPCGKEAMKSYWPCPRNPKLPKGDKEDFIFPIQNDENKSLWIIENGKYEKKEEE